MTQLTPDSDDVRALTALLDLMAEFPSNEQRARYLLSSNSLRDCGAAAAARITAALRALEVSR